LKHRLSQLILGQKGGHNRIEIIKLLKDRPYNLNQLAAILNLNYRTVKHHVKVLQKNELIGTSSAGSYGEVFFLSPEMEGNMDVLNDIITKFNSSLKLKNFTTSPKFFQRVIEQTNDAVIIIDMDFKVFFWNKSAEYLYGFKNDEIAEETIPIFQDNNHLEKLIDDVKSSRHITGYETVLKNNKNKMIDVEITMDKIVDDKNNILGVSIISRDISARKEAEKEKKITINILERLNRSGNGKELIGDLLTMVKEFAGFEAVGIRLKSEVDYPYFITRGFPGHFVESEKYLCARDKDGKPILDSNQTPVLECMCGTVIMGRTDPTKSFFTPNGSFWTNSTTDLLKTENDLSTITPTRNVCNQEGYESVALVPLRSDKDIIGLLQLNDKIPGRFTQNKIDFFEKIGASIGIAFHRMGMEEFLSNREK
jgi:PAS domain S-box-containing protein